MWVAPIRELRADWLDAINYVLVPLNGKDDDWRVPGDGEVEHAAHETPEKRIESIKGRSSLNCVSLRSEFDYE